MEIGKKLLLSPSKPNSYRVHVWLGIVTHLSVKLPFSPIAPHSFALKTISAMEGSRMGSGFPSKAVNATAMFKPFLKSKNLH